MSAWLQRAAGEGRSPDEIRDAVYLFTGDVAAKQSRFWLLLVLATGIATAGVISDSTATVIGAMIIAPLAVPIQGLAVGIAFGELGAVLRSTATVLLAVALAVGLAAVMALVLPELKPLSDNGQVTARVSPTLVDLVAAALTGLAGAFAISRRDVGDILPGVAIAISLVPPLAVVGVTAVDRDWDGALGALLLFLTNDLAIVVVGTALFSLLRRWDAQLPLRAKRRVYAVIAGASMVVVGALALATYRTVALSNAQDEATQISSTWARQHGERLLGTRFEGDKLVVEVEGTTDGTQDRDLPGLLGGAVPGGTPVVVDRVAGRRSTIGEVER